MNQLWCGASLRARRRSFAVARKKSWRSLKGAQRFGLWWRSAAFPTDGRGKFSCLNRKSPEILFVTFAPMATYSNCSG
jgi:hypothetical protein